MNTDRLNKLNEFLISKNLEIELRKKILEKISGNVLVRECMSYEIPLESIDLCKELKQTICRDSISNFKTAETIVLKTGKSYCDLVKGLVTFIDSLNEYNEKYLYTPHGPNLPQLTIELSNKNLIKGEFASYKTHLVLNGDPDVHLVELITEAEDLIDTKEIDNAFIQWTIDQITILLNQTNYGHIWLPDIVTVTTETKTRVATVLIHLYNSIDIEMISFRLGLDPLGYEFLSQTLINLTHDQEQTIYDNKHTILQILEKLIGSLIYSGGDTVLLIKTLIRDELNDLAIRCLLDKNLLHIAINECFRYIFQGYISKWNLLTKIFDLINSNIIPGYLIEGPEIGINNVFEELLFLPDLRNAVTSMRRIIEPTTYRYLNDLLRN